MTLKFKTPKLSVVSSYEGFNAKIVPYKFQEEKVIVSEDIPKEIKSVLPKKDGSVFSALIDGKYVVYVCFGKKSVEDVIVKAIKSIPESYDKIMLVLKGVDFNAKLISSKIINELKEPWSLKKKGVQKKNKDVYLQVDNDSSVDYKKGKHLGVSQALVQKLVNMPSNYLTPTKFSEIAQEIVSSFKGENFTIEVLGLEDIQKKNMGSLLGVSKGSVEEPKVIVMKYLGNKNSLENDVVLVGKGLTFDSGGISIKPSLGMGAMKGDMAGAATAVGAIYYAAQEKLPINMVVIAACCENMPSGSATKPGDVLTAMDGTTIEVIDTDAEGRLVLADALLYSQEFKGKHTIDMATLTGACIVALGYVHTGLFTEDDSLANNLLEAGKKIKDTAWRMPMDEEYDELLDSKVADVSNLFIGKGAGAQNGAVFLRKFAPKNGWCHLDIAGTSAHKGGEATSRPLAMISEYLDSLR